MAMSIDDNGASADMSRRDELEALLPFYLNGTLEGSDLAAVEHWLATDAEAAAALAEAELEFSGASAANEAIRPPPDALSRFARALEAEAGPERAAEPSLFAKLWDAFWSIPASVAWAAAAAAVALVLVQTVMEPGGRGAVEIAGTGQAEQPFALVTFKPDARMSDIAAFLSEQGASIVSGPAPGGVFKVVIPAGTVAEYDRIVGLIAAQPFADTAITGRKPDNGG
ncbi:anti-sigma factor [Mesorhizobium marinum]|uniref:anti-sigma factor n=1 Tax=Mesorhizobium marinum TaxID=3228790 RepID=UPI003466B9E8